MDIDLSKALVLVHFYEENKYSVLRYKKAVTIEEEIDVSTWDQKKSIEVLWNGQTYPGNIIQFGENKKDMDTMIDKLADGSICVSDIPVLQNTRLETTRVVAKSVADDTSKSNSFKKQKLDTTSKSMMNDMNVIDDIYTKLSDETRQQQKECNCVELRKKLDIMHEEKSQTEAVLKSQSEKIICLENKVEKYKKKYSSYKEKYNKSSAILVEENRTRIGSSLTVSTDKLNMCRTSGYAKFVGDLMEVVFGREVLGNSVIKGIKSKSTKTNILDPEAVMEIQAYVSNKFNVDQALVRAAIRRKLNFTDRLTKETNL